MKKTLALALKDLRITLRDRSALLMMLALPLGLTMIAFFAFGGSGGDSGPEAVPVVIFNADSGSLGKELVNVYSSEELADLFIPAEVFTEAEARQALEEDQAAAAVLIPEDFSSSLSTHAMEQGSSTLFILVNPARTISAFIVQSVATRFTEIVNTSTVGTEATFAGLIKSGRINPDDIASMAAGIGGELGAQMAGSETITIELVEPQAPEGESFSFSSVNFLEYYAAAMAVLGLMFSLTASSRSILAERESGTLARFLTTPATGAALIGGKILAAVLTGCLQMLVLVVVTTLLLDAGWGAPLPLAVFTIVLVSAIAAMGMLIAAFARSHAQAGMLGSAVTLVLSAASGNFLPRQAYPLWLQKLSLIGPSAWGIEGFQALAAGADLSHLGTPILALAGMSLVLYGLALAGLRRQLQ